MSLLTKFLWFYVALSPSTFPATATGDLATAVTTAATKTHTPATAIAIVILYYFKKII
jgi:hypothetical protein